MAGTLYVRGLRELVTACDLSGPTLRKFTRDRLRAAGNIVRASATALFASVDERSAAGYRVAVRRRGVAVEQSLPRTTGKRPDYGAKQMREALSPALDRNTNAVIRQLEHGLDDLADAHW